ncbi:MAG: carboxypeptidase-like regulatory domain-containing protein, partial [Bacteroidales bacterium]|nr:carboxypeptidase-like regulatory domain-containing protein [Bacteroidales bacterium]
MIFKKIASTLTLFILIWIQVVSAQEKITVSGFVMDTKSHALELVNVSEFNGRIATYTDESGFYSIQLPKADTIILKYSCLSYQTATRIIPAEMKSLRVNVTLGSSSRTLNEIVIRGQQRQTNTLETLDASKVRLLPDASGGSIEALLVTFAGVSSNNELSSQYSVRGGNYDE